MGEVMKLSIIVPVYNMAADDKLKHCIDSLLNQTITDYEIIAVDDASTDESLKILREYEAAYEGFIKVVACSENHRQGGAKNRGLELASGEWVGFIDSDDWIHPDMYKNLIEKAEDTGADFVGCDYNIVSEYTFDVGQVAVNNSQEQTGELDDARHEMHILQNGSMVVKVYKRSVITENGLKFPEGIFYEDNMAAPYWSLFFTHFERVPEPFYYYLTVPSSTTHHVSWSKCQDRMTAGELMIKACREREEYIRLKDAIDYRFTELYYITTLLSYMIDGEKKKLSNVRKLKEGILKYVPNFRENKYYDERVSVENKKLIDLHMKSNFLFFIYFNLLFEYRKFRKRIANKKQLTAGEENE